MFCETIGFLTSLVFVSAVERLSYIPEIIIGSKLLSTELHENQLQQKSELHENS